MGRNEGRKIGLLPGPIYIVHGLTVALEPAVPARPAGETHMLHIHCTMYQGAYITLYDSPGPGLLATFVEERSKQGVGLPDRVHQGVVQYHHTTRWSSLIILVHVHGTGKVVNFAENDFVQWQDPGMKKEVECNCMHRRIVSQIPSQAYLANMHKWSCTAH